MENLKTITKPKTTQKHLNKLTYKVTNTALNKIKISEQIRFRNPNENDAASIWNLVKETGVLDLNSAYSYLMLCKFYADTCLIAEKDNQLVGFVSAFQPPKHEDVIFVWQIAVSQSQRGKGLATRLLKKLLQLKSCSKVRFIEATVSPSNIPSQSLFRGLARDLKTECKVSECFSADMFPGNEHEDELTHRVGPFSTKIIK